MSITKSAGGGAAERVRDILDEVERERPVGGAAFAEAREALTAERLSPLARATIGNMLDAAEGYVVETGRGYFPGAGRWSLRQALARLAAVPA